MRVAHGDHGAQDVVPGLRFLHDLIREHAAVPADMFDAAFFRALQPVARALHDIELAVGIIG